MDEEQLWSESEWNWDIERDSAEGESRPENQHTEITVRTDNSTLEMKVESPKKNKTEDAGVSRFGMPSEPVRPAWCEISLDTDEERTEINELHASHSIERQDDSQETQIATTETLTNGGSSLAYQLGMMVVSKAAKVVHNVADVSGRGSGDADELQKSREELEKWQMRNESLTTELLNAKEWASYYETMQQNLDRQFNETTERYEAAKMDLECKLEMSLTEVDRMRTELEETKRENLDLRDVLQSTQDVVKELESETVNDKRESKEIETQTEENRIVKEPVQIAPETIPPATECGVQCDLMESSDAEESLVSSLRVALDSANARCDQLRRRLMTSLESMRAQTGQMRTSRVALETALNQSRDLGGQLEQEKVKLAAAQKELGLALKAEDKLKRELGERDERVASQARRLQELENVVSEANSRVEQREADLAIERVLNSCLHKAETEAVRVDLRDALTRCELLDEQAQNYRAGAAQLQIHVEKLREENAHKAGELENALESVTRLTERAKLNEAEIRQSAEAVKRAEAIVLERNRDAAAIKLNYQHLLQLRAKEMKSLDRMAANLERENAGLRTLVDRQAQELDCARNDGDLTAEKLRQKIETLKADLRESNGRSTALEKELGEARRAYDELEREKTGLESSHQQQLAECQRELGEARESNHELMQVTEEDRRALTSYDHALRSAREDCARLDWICRDQNQRIAALQRQNLSLRTQLETGLNRLEQESESRSEIADDHEGRFERGDAPSTLSTIHEAEEKSSTSKASTRESATPDSDVKLVQRQDSAASSSPSGRIAVVESDLNRQTSSTSSSNARKIRSKARHPHKRHRQKLSRNTQFTSQQATTSHQLAASDSEDSVFVPASVPTSSPRLGVPMQQAEYERLHEAPVSASGKDHDHGNSSHFSHDDGYASSYQSPPHPPPRRRRSSSSSDVTDDSYYVTYDGVTFDVAAFSLARMRQLTSTCSSTSTPEGMDAFFEFLARKAAELNSDPRWRGRHSLGQPSDWLSMRGCY